MFKRIAGADEELVLAGDGSRPEVIEIVPDKRAFFQDGTPQKAGEAFRYNPQRLSFGMGIYGFDPDPVFRRGQLFAIRVLLEPDLFPYKESLQVDFYSQVEFCGFFECQCCSGKILNGESDRFKKRHLRFRFPP